VKKRVYLDTTIPSHHFDVRAETAFLATVTKRWFKTEARHYNIFVSEATLVEISAGRYPHKQRILRFAEKRKVLRSHPILEQIVEVYIRNLLMPEDRGGDGLHLAYASYYRMDFLLTWNCTHLANANKREHIRIINHRLGLSVPEIVTPLELISEGDAK